MIMAVTKYIWDEDNLLAEADANNTINVVYTHEPQKYGKLISTRIGNNTSYHHYDGLGSTRQLTNSAGTVTDTMIYDAWGNVVSRTGTTNISLLWIGEVGYYFDAETGLFWVRARYYAAALSRWLSRDPVARNRAFPYVQSFNNVLAFTDPSGLDVSGLCVCSCPHRMNVRQTTITASTTDKWLTECKAFCNKSSDCAISNQSLSSPPIPPPPRPLVITLPLSTAQCIGFCMSITAGTVRQCNLQIAFGAGCADWIRNTIGNLDFCGRLRQNLAALAVNGAFSLDTCRGGCTCNRTQTIADEPISIPLADVTLPAWYFVAPGATYTFRPHRLLPELTFDIEGLSAGCDVTINGNVIIDGASGWIGECAPP
jgi:RHS repeat-associated protein